MELKGESLLAAFSALKVLIIGDVMIDAYDWGHVERISPEAPVPIVHLTKSESRLGGAANVALNVQALGAVPLLCAAVGNDAEGEAFLQLLKKENMDTQGIVICKHRPTTTKRRILAGSQQLLRVDSETEKPLNQEDGHDLRQKIEALIPKVDIVLFEDYDKGLITPELISKVVSACHALQKPVTVDPKKRNFLAYKNVSLFKPNLKELKEGLKKDFNPDNFEELEQAVAQLHTQLNAENYLITLSEKGVYYKTPTESGLIPAHKREISDVSGAGDTVISTASLCLALQFEIPLLASLANLSGGLVCEYVGVVPINKIELIKEAQRLGMLE